jgi:hypothetical protein
MAEVLGEVRLAANVSGCKMFSHTSGAIDTLGPIFYDLGSLSDDDRIFQ